MMCMHWCSVPYLRLRPHNLVFCTKYVTDDAIQQDPCSEVVPGNWFQGSIISNVYYLSSH